MSGLKPVNGILWQDGVIANVKWTGVRLSDVLKYAGIQSDGAAHVCFASHATLCEDDHYYGASIPLVKAIAPDGDVLLALEVRPFTSS